MFSLVIPVYRNEASIEALLQRLHRLRDLMRDRLEAVLVVDGSPDRSLERLREALPQAPFPSQLLVLSRNFGSFAAIVAGLEHARGERFAVMAADLQEPEELILAFGERLARDDCDVVLARRETRTDPPASRLLSAIFWATYRLFIQREVPPGGIDVFACNRAFRDQLLALRERNSTLVGLVCWLGFRRAEIAYARQPRREGRSAWTFRRRARYLLDSSFAFSHLPIRLMELAGVLGLSLAVVLATIVVYARLRGDIVVPGYSATVLVVMFFGALNALGIGLLGEYVWRAFENTKGRPAYVVARRLCFGEPGEES